MQPNPVLKKLGFSEKDRVVIIHADDIGMSQSSLTAYADLLDFGLVSSAATMVPCGWFPATAAFCREHPEADMGVHITLTCEWDAYRWPPLSTVDPASGLLDSEGYLPRTSREIQEKGDPAAVGAEIEAQIARALAAGVDATHIDSHMGSVFHPKFLPVYMQTGLKHRLPPFMLRWDREQIKRERGMDDETAQATARMIEILEEQGIPLFDGIGGMPLEGEKPIELAQEQLNALPSGLSVFIIHPSHDTPELRAVARDWPARVADYQLFSSEKLRDFIREQGIHVIGYRPLRDLLRQ